MPSYRVLRLWHHRLSLNLIVRRPWRSAEPAHNEIKKGRTGVLPPKAIPKYFANHLLQRREGCGGASSRGGYRSRGSRAGSPADNRIFRGAELTHASLVKAERNRARAVGDQLSPSRTGKTRIPEGIAALGAGCQHGVNQASRRGRGCAGASDARARPQIT